MTLKTSIELSVQAVQTNAIDLGGASASRTLATAFNLASGVGAGQADLVFADSRTLAASGTEDLDLAGALADAFAVAQVFVRVKGIFVKADAANTNNVNVTRPASNGFALFLAAGDGVGVRPGETLALFAGPADVIGHTVTPATGDLLTITNAAAGTPVTYSIVIIGASA